MAEEHAGFGREHDAEGEEVGAQPDHESPQRPGAVVPAVAVSGRVDQRCDVLDDGRPAGFVRTVRRETGEVQAEKNDQRGDDSR